MPWTTNDFVASVRRTGWLPDADDIESSDILAWADAELRGDPGALLKRAREEHRIRTVDVPLVAGQTRYRIPRRALGRAVRGVSYVDSAGSESEANEVSPLDLVEAFATRGLAYYFERDHIVLPTAPRTSTGALRVRYETRPPRLVLTSDAAAINGVVPEGNGLDCASLPTWLSALEGNQIYVDIVRGDSPFDASHEDLIVVDVDGTSLEFDPSTPIDADEIAEQDILGERRDYVCRRDETVYPPLPEEMHGLLELATISRALVARKDFDSAAAVRAEYQRHASAAKTMIEPRNAGKRRSIANRNSPLRARGRLPGWVR